ncbi:hypothetical protein AB0K71_27110 [Streptomyces syringium]|uniref:hypothetical protein n=1 Tax=Streptomyces syringium TaxID=76729 RepID=UPI00341219B3
MTPDSQYADPAVCAIVFGAPTALVLAIARLAKKAKPAPEIHQHYTGPVNQRATTVNTRKTVIKWNRFQG